MASEPNLRVLEPSRKAPQNGDVFTLSPAPNTFLFGRVVAADAAVGPMAAVMIYIYDAILSDATVPAPERLTPTHLLLPPLLTNRLPWSRGYFKTLRRSGLQPEDTLSVHCFRDSRGRFHDEHSRLISGPIEPVGQWALQSFRTVDDAVSDALGIPRAPD